jgi:PKD repeat protein
VVTTRTGLTAVEGKPASIVPGSFTDTGGSGPFLAEANWGDGSAVGLYPVGAAGALPAATHTFAKAGTYHGTVTVIDATGHLSTATPLTVRVADAPLSGSASPRSGVAAGAPFADHVAAFTDADPNGTVTDYSAKINWGDGTTSVGVVASTTLGATTGPFGVTGTHTYAKAGTYKFSVTVADFGGSTLTVSSTVTCVNAKSIVVNTITASWSSPA